VRRTKLQRTGAVEAIREGVSRGLTLDAAAALAGVHRSTLHRWRTRAADTPELEGLQEAFAVARAEDLNWLLSLARRQAEDGDGNMVRFLLERVHGMHAKAALQVSSVATEPAEEVRYIVTIPRVERLGERHAFRDGDEDGATD